jgi:hypothetical protein
MQCHESTTQPRCPRGSGLRALRTELLRLRQLALLLALAPLPIPVPLPHPLAPREQRRRLRLLALLIQAMLVMSLVVGCCASGESRGDARAHAHTHARACTAGNSGQISLSISLSILRGTVVQHGRPDPRRMTAWTRPDGRVNTATHSHGGHVCAKNVIGAAIAAGVGCPLVCCALFAWRGATQPPLRIGSAAGLFGPAKLEEGAAGEGLPGGDWLQRLDD